MEYLNEMVVFAKVVELRSFSEAGRRLGVTSSAVSRSVGRLEAHVGGRLLHRTTRSVAPTELGHELFGRCTLIAETARDVKMIAGRYASAPVGRLRISAPVALGSMWLGARLPGFLRRWPEVEVELRLADEQPDLVDNSLDAALAVATTLPQGVVARALMRTVHVLVASPGYLQSHGQPRLPAQLARHACILPDPHEAGQNLGLSDGQDKVQVQVRGQLTVDNGLAALAAVQAGLGVGLVPDYSAEVALQDGRIVRLLPEWTLQGTYGERKVYALHAPTRHLPQKVRAFIDYLAPDCRTTPTP